MASPRFPAAAIGKRHAPQYTTMNENVRFVGQDCILPTGDKLQTYPTLSEAFH